MSEGKAGSVTIGPVGIAAGGVAAVAVLVVGGIAAGVVASVNMYRAARERVEREREQASNEQKRETNRVLDEWLNRLASSYSQQDEATPTVRSTDEIMAETVTGLPTSTDLEDGELLAVLKESEQLQAPPLKVEVPDPKPLRDLIKNLQELLMKVNIPLPPGIGEMIDMLHNEQDIEKAAYLARDIRMKIIDEMNRIEQEKQEAREILESLPPDFPTEARAVLSEAAEGRTRFDQELKTIILDAQKQMQAIRKQAAAKILNNSFAEMGYVVEPVGESLFTEGGEVYFRKSEWEDGYCVKLKVKGETIKFFMQKTAETGDEYDRDMGQEWKSQFPEVQKKLADANINIDVRELFAPGKRKVQKVDNIPIDTRKIRTSTGPVEEGRKGSNVTIAAKKSRMEKSI